MFQNRRLLFWKNRICHYTCFYIALLLLSFFRNPCCDVESGSISSAPASSSLNYLRLLPSAARTNENSVSNISEEGNWRENSNSCTENGYVTPRPSSVITCGCQTLQSSQYQNLSTDHTCPSTTSSVAWNKYYTFSIYPTRAIITRSWFETTRKYKPQILRLRNVFYNTNCSVV